MMAKENVLVSQQLVLMKGLEALLSEGVLCDVTLCAEDKEIKVHKCVLAASSPYFRAMFCLDTAENACNVVQLRNVAGFILEDLVKFLYTGNIVLTGENVQSLVSTANMMQIDNLVQMCVEFMGEAISVDNCVDVYTFADFQNLHGLMEKAESFILENFMCLYESGSFSEITFSNLIKVLNSDNLNVPNERIVFECLMSWVESDIDSRHDNLSELLSFVRVGCLDYGYVKSVICNHPLISDHKECYTMMSKALSFLSGNERDSSVDICVSPRIGMFNKEMLVFSGGAYTAQDRSFCCFDPETKKSYYAIKQHPTFDFKFKIDLYKLVVTDSNEIFFLGGIFYDDYHFETGGAEAKDTVLVYNQKDRNWQECHQMPSPKCAFAACHHEGKIYTFGGYKRYPRNSPDADVAVYNTETDKWSVCDEMPVEIAHQAATVYEDSIFLFGGLDIDNEFLNTVLQYTFSKDHWALVKTEMPCPRAEATAITHEQKIFILGGMNSSGSIASVNIFNPGRTRWSFGEDFPDERKYTSITKNENCIYVCGGVKHSLARTGSLRRSKTVETRDLYKYTISDNKWTKEARFVEYGSSHACAWATVNLKMLKASDFVAQV